MPCGGLVGVREELHGASRAGKGRKKRRRSNSACVCQQTRQGLRGRVAADELPLRLHKAKIVGDPGGAQAKALRANFRRIDRQEWWLWAAAVVITLLLTMGLASFLVPNSSLHQDFDSIHVLPPAIRGLVGLVFLFDLYTIYQHLIIHRIRKELVEREELFHLISENAADMIAVVDMQGKRLFNSLSYRKVLGYSPEELQASSAFEQIHPEDRERVKKAADEAMRSGIGRPWSTACATRMARGLCWSPRRASFATPRASRKNWSS
jgi:PAS domain-containing protein